MSRTKKSLIALLVCYLIWGLQPLYWNLLGQFDALFVLCVRIVMSVIFTWGFLICTGRLHELLAAFRNRALMKYLVPAAVFICGDWGLYNWAVMNGHVLDVSLGYYMNPMVMFVIGLALFRERGCVKADCINFADRQLSFTGITSSFLQKNWNFSECIAIFDRKTQDLFSRSFMVLGNFYWPLLRSYRRL